MDPTERQQRAAAATSAIFARRRAEERALLAEADALNLDGGPWSGWADDALCPQVGPHLFVAGSEDRSAFELARRVCLMCPVRIECLADALAVGEAQGVRGGISMTSLRVDARRFREVA